MEWVLLLIAFAIGAMIFGAVAGAVSGASAGGKREAAAARKDAILNPLFSDSAPDVVSYKTQPADTLRAPLVIEGALQRGYRLVHDDSGTLTFQRIR